MKKMRMSFLMLIAVAGFGFLSLNCGDSSSDSNSPTASQTAVSTATATSGGATATATNGGGATATSGGTTIAITGAVWAGEAEVGTVSGAAVATTDTGFSGTGYVNFTSATDVLTVLIPSSAISGFDTTASKYTIGFRYKAVAKASMNIYVNEAEDWVGDKTKGFTANTDWESSSNGERVINKAIVLDANGNIVIKLKGKDSTSLILIDMVYIK